MFPDKENLPDGLQPAAGRVQASRLALTWSCPTDQEVHPFDVHTLDALMKQVEAINVGVQRVDEIVLSKEKHVSGKSHYHCYVKYSSRINVRDMRRWDLHGVHPNIATVSDWKGWVKYVIKDGLYVYKNINLADLTRPTKSERSGAWEKALCVVRETADPNKGCEILKTLQPQQWILNSSRISATLTMEAALVHSSRFPLNVKDTRWIDDVCAINILDKEEGADLTPVTILVGETGIGKTEAAKYLLKKAMGDSTRILFVNHAEDFKGKEGLYDCFVWDEANFNSPQTANRIPWAREQQIAICGWDNHPRTLHTRHSNVVIPPGIPRVFTCNYLPRCVDMHDAAIARRCRVVDFGNQKLFA